ncbi:hypothetical protein A2774_04925 [Candidatus Roizmanbacteria bacterium RIFCSPHIGHO2_01_FULL_39_12c]|uniref:Glycosyltransferase RgtA/B/C/D-like domain-containing protein n=1 Tax=Candidatus Roizmanbacteria bacterium RIFCSPHIGHO2_01_FULL_39_12c TaxID=1802031 RepID=A0A1F7GBA2_9BACT|nr:MAG: hypothetical protein A2774_04925 [Candidatus Roizmanbacteria bacterium RIFCSPHIGHO2_01_FULL_39_12c]
MFSILLFIKRHLLLSIFIALLLLLIFLTYRDFGIPWDEKVFYNTGRYYTAKIFNRAGIPIYIDSQGFTPTDYHIKGHGVVYDIFVFILTLPWQNFTYENLHLLRALIAVLIFVVLYLIARRFFSVQLAVFPLIILLLTPRFFPDMFYNAIDIPGALLFSLCIWLFISYIKSKPKLLNSVVLSLILAITINHRLILSYIFLANFLFFVIYNFKTKKMTWSYFLAINALLGVLTLFFLHLTHPVLLAKPVSGLVDLFVAVRQYKWDSAVLFEGRFYQAGHPPLPLYYLPKTILISLPPVTIILFLLGLAGLLAGIFRKKLKSFKDFLYLYLLFLSVVPFIIVFALRPTMYDSWRHFTFLLIPMSIFATYGMQAILQLKYAAVKKILLILLTVGYISTAVAMIRLHPYEYIYYNFLVGGFKGAYDKYELDYWGLAYKETVDWFDKNINDGKRNYFIYVEGDPLSSSYYFSKNVQITPNVLHSNYIFAFTRWDIYKFHPGKTVHIIKKDGVPLVYIKLPGDYSKAPNPFMLKD